MKLSSRDEKRGKKLERIRSFSSALGKYDNIPLASAILENLDRLKGFDNKRPLVFSISGAPGTGKTTFAKALGIALKKKFGISVSRVSLDDFYLPRAERMELARSIHPLLITRGPPGTHDVKKLSQVIESLRSGFPARSPVFDKVLDDRVKQDRLIEPAPVLVCEGWFLGAVPQSIYALDQPVNEFERIKDKDGIWRSWVNDQIVLYKEIFFSDVLIFLRAPSFGASITWRRAQEAENEEVSETKRRRNSFDVEEFLKHFERLMLWINEDLPTRSQIQIIFDENHNIEKIIDASRNE